MKKAGVIKRIIRFICICLFFGLIYAFINTGNILHDYLIIIVIALVLALLASFIEGYINQKKH